MYSLHVCTVYMSVFFPAYAENVIIFNEKPALSSLTFKDELLKLNNYFIKHTSCVGLSGRAL